jgi:hypothetical protein
MVSVESRQDDPFDDDAFVRGEIGTIGYPSDDGGGHYSGTEPSPERDREAPPLPDGTEIGSEYRWLMITEPAVLAAYGSGDDEEALWSFRALMQWLADDPEGPTRYALGFLEGWAEGGAAPPRPGVRRYLIDGWTDVAPPAEAPPAPVAAPDAGAAGGDAPDYVSAAPQDGGETNEPVGPRARWQDAPFRLIAIVPRVDLASDACSGSAGELRYVYAGSDWRQKRHLRSGLRYIFDSV